MSTSMIRDVAGSRVLRSIYKRTSTQIFANHGLKPASDIAPLADYVGVRSGVCCAVNDGFTMPAPDCSVVVGGGCLSYSGADVAKVRCDYIADTMAALAFAAWSGIDCVIYLPIGEELLAAKDGESPLWHAFGDLIEVVAGRLAMTIDTPRRVTIIRTDRHDVRERLADAIQTHTSLVSESELRDLYTIGRSSSGSASMPGKARLDQYRSTIATYVPEVLRDLTGSRSWRHVVAAENLHQVKAINAARHVAASLRQADRIDHLAHIPPPSLSGSNRMARAGDESAFIVADRPETSAAKIARMRADAAAQWNAIWYLHRAMARTSHVGELHAMTALYRKLVMGVGDDDI